MDPRVSKWLAGVPLQDFPYSGDPFDDATYYKKDLDSDDFSNNDGTSSESDDQSVENIQGECRQFPDWFNDQSFQFNGRMFILSLPGILLLLIIGGEVMLSIGTLGSVIIYLLHVAGQKHKTVYAFYITYACCHVNVAYSFFPLIWTSIFNCLLLFMINVYCVMFGSWIVIQFKLFRHKDPEMTKHIETLLFGIFPAVNVVLLTWMVSVTISLKLAPYTILIIGFIVLHVFLTPTWSSFYRKDLINLTDINSAHILTPYMTGTIAYGYALCPPFVYLFSEAATNPVSLPRLFIASCLEFAFLTFLSCYLATFLNLRQYLEQSDISLTSFVKFRWCVGVLSLLCLSSVLQAHGFVMYLMPWLSLGVVIHSAYGVFINQKKTKIPSVIAAFFLALLYVFMFSQLPWKIEYFFINGSLSLMFFNLLLIVNAILCFLCIYASVHLSTEFLEISCILQSFVLVFCEKALFHSDSYQLYLLGSSSAFMFYFLMRLQHVKKLGKSVTCLLISIHASKLIDACIMFKTESYVQSSSPSIDFLYAQLSTFSLMLCMTHIFLFMESKIMRSLELLVILLKTSIVLSFNLPFLFFKIHWILLGEDPVFTDLLAFIALLLAFVSLKLCTSHTQSGHIAPYLPIIMTAVAIGLYQLKPDFTLFWLDISKWIFIAAISHLLFLISSVSEKYSPKYVYPSGICSGFLIGYIIASWIFSETKALWFISYPCCGLIFGFSAVLALLLLRKQTKFEKKIFILCSLLILSCLILLGVLVMETCDDNMTNLMPGLPQVAILCIAVAMICKVYSLKEQEVSLTHEIGTSVPNIGLIGNVSTILGYVLFCYYCPFPSQWQLWFAACSLLFVLLQKDGIIMEEFPMINCFLLYLTSIVLILIKTSCDVNYANLISYQFGSILSWLIENVLLILSFIAFCACSHKLIIPSSSLHIDYVIIFITPLTTFLFVFGNCYSSWILSCIVLSMFAWLLKYKMIFSNN